MVMKLYGLGPQLYFKSQFNTFDCVVRYLLSSLLCLFSSASRPWLPTIPPKRRASSQAKVHVDFQSHHLGFCAIQQRVLVRKSTPTMLLSLIFIFLMYFLQVVCCGIIELIISKAEGTSLGISVLRALRLLRLFKFTRWSILPFDNMNLVVKMVLYLAICNGNRTEWSPIQSVIIRVINKIGRPRSGIPICLIMSMISIGNSMVCSDIWHKYHEWCFEIVNLIGHQLLWFQPLY